jgi:hypothetical protein
MKILLFNKAYKLHINPSNPCSECIMKGNVCIKMPAEFCIEYGGFQSSDTKIFTL